MAKNRLIENIEVAGNINKIAINQNIEFMNNFNINIEVKYDFKTVFLEYKK